MHVGFLWHLTTFIFWFSQPLDSPPPRAATDAPAHTSSDVTDVHQPGCNMKKPVC